MTGLASTSASKAALIFALNALVAPLFSRWVFKRAVPRRAYAAVAVALVGLGVMTWTGQGVFNPGDGWSFAGALCFGLYIAYVGEVAHKAPPLPLVQTQYAVMTLILTAWAWPQFAIVPP